MTGEELLKAMETALDARLPLVDKYDSYYRGNQRLAFATTKWRETFGALFDMLADNWCQLVIDASVERLNVEGFRFGPSTEGADEDAWQLWQANYLDADSVLAHAEASKTGVTYLLVLPGVDPETPRITVEHPAQTITYVSPADRRKVLAAFKRWREDDGTSAAMLYTPESFVRLDRSKNATRWTESASIPNPIGVVPCVPMLNLPTIMGSGMSDLNAVVPLQDAINKLLADMLVNSEYVAFPQRFATGLEIPTDPQTGRPLDREAFLSSVSRMWVAENKDVKFGELSGSDGLGYVRQIEALIQHIAAQTRTPPHYLLGQSGAFPSGESLKATETGLVAKVRRKQVTYGEAWEDAMRLAFAYRGDVTRAQALDAETIWSDPESRSEGELMDALLKAQTLGVPPEALWRRWGASPQEIAEWARALPTAVSRDPRTPPIDEPDQTPPELPPTQPPEAGRNG